MTSDTKHQQLEAMRAFSNNHTPRLPILFLLDNSSSMNGIVSCDNRQVIGNETRDGISWNIVTADNIQTRMDELNKGLGLFINEILADSMALLSADISIMSFAGTTNSVKDFSPISESDTQLTLAVSNEDETRLGEAIEKAILAIDERKSTYKSNGIEYYQPWLILITDGVPTGMKHREMQSTLKSLADAKQLSVFAFTVCNSDLSELSYVSPNRPPMKINEQKLTELFSWLSRSVSMVSMSIPGEAVILNAPPEDIWKV